MKKITIAALVAASFGASAQVSLTGKVSEWVDSNKVGATTSTSIAAAPTSNITISVNEKLGGGLTARAIADTSLSGNSIAGAGTQLGDRQGTVGLASSMGAVDFGRNVHSEFIAITSNDPFGTMYGSIAGDVHNLRGLRLSDGMFVSMTPIKGVTATWDRSNSPTGADKTSYSVSGSFAGVAATVAAYTSGVEKSTVAALSAKLGGTNVSFTHSDNKSAAAGETKKGDMIGASQALGAFVAKASYGKTNTNVKAYSVGGDYNLSKRTAVGVAYRNVDMVATKSDVKQIGVGLTHLF